MQKHLIIIWPILVGILIALIIVREFPLFFLQNKSLGLYHPTVRTEKSNNHFSKIGFSYAVKQAAPTVVNIYTSNAPEFDHLNPLTKNKDHSYLQPKSSRWQDDRPNRLGSGVIVSQKGYIVTLQHVIESANKIIVELQDGRTALARIVGIDLETDLAVLSIDLSELPVAVTSRSPSSIGDIVFGIIS